MTAAQTRPSSTEGDKELVLRHAPQGEMLYKFQQSKAFVQILIGPLGSAKTTDACIKMLKCINDQPPNRNGVRKSRWLVMRNTTVDLKATTIKDWRQVATDDLGPFKMDAPITHHLRWKHEDRRTYIEAEVLFVGFDALVDVRKLRGYQLTGLWIDEAKEIPKAVVDMALGRLRRYPSRAEVEKYPSMALLTSNAPAGDEWLAKLAKNPPDNYDVFVQPGGVIKVNGHWQKNPKGENVHNLDDEYYSGQIAGKKEAWIRQNLANEFVVVTDGRPVHPDFSQELHIAKWKLRPTAGIPIRIGCDWGRTPAAVFTQEQPNGQLWVLAEITTENTSIPKFGRAVRRMMVTDYEGFEFDDCYGDPSGTSYGYRDESCFDLMAAEKVEVYPAPTNDPDIRFAALDRRLTMLTGGEPGILVDPGCELLIRGLSGGYKFKRVNVAGYEDRYHDKPDKTIESHICEALHYDLIGHGDGDMVTDQSGFAEEYARVESEYGGWHPNQAVFE